MLMYPRYFWIDSDLDLGYYEIERRTSIKSICFDRVCMRILTGSHLVSLLDFPYQDIIFIWAKMLVEMSFHPLLSSQIAIESRKSS